MLGTDPPVQYALDTDPRKLFPEPSAATPLACARAPIAHVEMPFACAAFVGWLDASRRVIDYWRYTVRQQQDAMLAMWQSQLTPPSPGAADPSTCPETPRRSAKS